MYKIARIMKSSVNVSQENPKVWRRLAGHSKWANIKHQKQIEDLQKNRLYGEMLRRMRNAVNESHDTNPVTNMKLAAAITDARKASIPIATIDNFLKKLHDRKNMTVFLEIHLPGGCILAVQLSEMPDQTKYILKTLTKEYNGVILKGQRSSFHQKAVIVTEPKDDPSKIEEDALEVDAEDFEIYPEDDKERVKFFCDKNYMPKMRGLLESLNYSILRSEIQSIPYNYVELNETDKKNAEALISKLRQVNSVVNVHHNMA